MSRIDGGLRTLFRERLPFFDWQSVETGGTGSGVPDSNFCCRGVEGWVEYKLTDAWAVPLLPEQVAWHTRRARHGGRTFIAVRRNCVAGVRRPAADELWLFPGSLARELKSGGLKAAPPLLCCAGGPLRWDWSEVARFLLRVVSP